MIIIACDFILLCFLIRFYKNKFQKMQQKLNALNKEVFVCSNNLMDLYRYVKRNQETTMKNFKILDKAINNNTIIETKKEEKTPIVYEKLDDNVIFFDFEKNLKKPLDNKNQ